MWASNALMPIETCDTEVIGRIVRRLGDVMASRSVLRVNSRSPGTDSGPSAHCQWNYPII